MCWRTVWPCNSSMLQYHKGHLQAGYLLLFYIWLHGHGKPHLLLPGGGTCLVNWSHLVADSPVAVPSVYGVGHLWCSGKWCLIDGNVTPPHSILDFILVMLHHICVFLFVPGLFLCKVDAVLDQVLPLTAVAGKFPRTVLKVLLSLAFLEWILECLLVSLKLLLNCAWWGWSLYDWSSMLCLVALP